MSLHIEYECIYVFVSFQVFLICFILEAVDLDDPFGIRCLFITLILINGSYSMYCSDFVFFLSQYRTRIFQ